ncbi:MAG: mandelate racemase/muconate lactonizing enzyme family protein [Dehalococcoidia bacterium]|nr:mandelate racemase/muconate lactonizing enzyme family protein [Dehalococcoidia bacterium]
MKVTDIERIVVDVPFTPRQQEITTQSVSTVYNWSILELCRVTTDTGHMGWGETVIHYTYGRVTDESVNRVLGSSPAELMNDDSLGAGLQMALFDVVGKILEVPVYELLGAKVRDYPPISWWSIDASPENWAAEAEDAVKHGYTSFKNKPRPWWDIVNQVDTIAKVVSTDFKLDLDPNGSFRDAETAIPVMSKLTQYDNVAMFETPIPQGDIPGNQQIRRAIDRPIAMHFGSPAYLTSINDQVCDGYVIGGGKSTVMRQGLLSAEADMPFWLQLVGNGLTTTWAAHLGAVLTHASWPAITCINLYSHHLLQKPIEVTGGSHKVPDAPGLGVVISEEAVEKYRVPPETLREFQQKDEHYIHPKPEIIHTVVYPNGKRLHMAGQGLGNFNVDYGPAQAEGTRLELWFNDGSKEWQNLHQRAQKSPVSD